jgi:hypothetical protein
MLVVFWATRQNIPRHAPTFAAGTTLRPEGTTARCWQTRWNAATPKE